jgi:hypothetical protein
MSMTGLARRWLRRLFKVLTAPRDTTELAADDPWGNFLQELRDVDHPK